MRHHFWNGEQSQQMWVLYECLLFAEVYDRALSKHKELLYVLSVTSNEQMFFFSHMQGSGERGGFRQKSNRNLQYVRGEMMFSRLPWDVVYSNKVIVSHHREIGLEHPKGRGYILPFTGSWWFMWMYRINLMSVIKEGKNGRCPEGCVSYMGRGSISMHLGIRGFSMVFEDGIG